MAFSRITGRARGSCAALLLLLSFGARAELRPLPEPLTLPDALALAEESPHPELEQAQAQLEAAEAGLAGARSRDDPTITLEGRLRWIEPSRVAPSDDTRDHQASIRLRKSIYDFGRTSSLTAAAEAELSGRSSLLQDTRLLRRMTVMRRFFDVLLADQTYARENEAMAVAYVDYDKVKNRHELGQISDLDLLASQSVYQATRVRRSTAQGEMRAARQRLALAMGRSDAVPATLTPPEPNSVKRELPDDQQLVNKALADNPLLKGLSQRVEGARQRMAAARAEGRPRLDAEIEGNRYHRELGSYDPWRGGVVLTIPLFTGGSVDAQVAREQSELHKLEAERRQGEFGVRQRVLELWLKLNTLKVQGEAVKVERDYRELYLDRSRAVYEMELKTDLGDAMVRLTEAQLAQMRRDFEVALAWEELDALTGGPGGPGDKNSGGRQ